MSKEVLVIMLGVWTALVPYLGLPGSWRTGILVVTGLLLAVLGFFLRREVIGRGAVHTADFFVDNRPRQEDIPHSHETAEQTRPRVQ